MKKRSINFTINLNNKVFYTFVAIFFMIIVGVGVYAYGTNSPATFGHSANELAAPSGCSNGQYLRYSTGSGGLGWNCATPSTSIPSTYVRNIQYVEAQSTSSGFPPSYTSTSVSVSCPSGKKIVSGGCRTGVTFFGSGAPVVTYSGPGGGSSYSSWICNFDKSPSETSSPTTPHEAFAFCGNW